MPVLGGVLSTLALCLLLALLVAVVKRKGFAIRGPRAARAERQLSGVWEQSQGLRANTRLGHMGAEANSLYEDDNEDAPWVKEYVPEIELLRESWGDSRVTLDVRVVRPAASIRRTRTSTEGQPSIAVALQETAPDNRTLALIRRAKTNPTTGVTMAPPPHCIPPGHAPQAALSLDDLLLGDACSGSTTRLPPPAPPEECLRL